MDRLRYNVFNPFIDSNIMIEITAKEYETIDMAPSPQNDTNSIRVFEKYDIDPKTFSKSNPTSYVEEFDSRYFILSIYEVIPVLKSMLAVKHELRRIAQRALEPDYVNKLVDYPQPKVIKEAAPRLNAVRDGDFRATLGQVEKDIEAIEYVILKSESKSITDDFVEWTGEHHIRHSYFKHDTDTIE